jgi:Dolichyl-phosphate-mannose-protein mannosyltransferase
MDSVPKGRRLTLVQGVRRLRVACTLPDTWLRVACFVIIGGSILQVLLFSYGRDQGIFAVIGQGLLRGQTPYLDLWDFKPPGIYFIYALAQALFGAEVSSIRLVEAGALLLNAYFLVALARRFFADSRPGLIAAAIGTWVYAQLEFWHTAQPDGFSGPLTLGALCLAVPSTLATGPATSGTFDIHRRPPIAAWLAIGALFGCVFLLKPPLVGPAMICAAYQLRLANDRGTGAGRGLLALGCMLVGGLVPLLGCYIWLVNRGASDALVWTFQQFTPGYSRLGWDKSPLVAVYNAAEIAFVRMSALFAVGSLAAVATARGSSREGEGITTIVGVIAMQLVGIALQAKFFEYHFSATVPLLALLAGLGFFKIWRAMVAQGPGGAVAFACVMGLCAAARRPVMDVPEGYWVRSYERLKYTVGLSAIKSQAQLEERFYRVADYNISADRALASRLQELTSPSDSIYIWGFEPAVYWFSQRRPASRFIYNVPQRSKWERETAREFLLADLKASTPAVIVVQHGDYFRFVTGDDFDSARALQDFPELLDMLKTQYTHLEQVEDFEIYRLNAAPTPTELRPAATKTP